MTDNPTPTDPTPTPSTLSVLKGLDAYLNRYPGDTTACKPMRAARDELVRLTTEQPEMSGANLVDRLRAAANPLCWQAADEIERLKAVEAEQPAPASTEPNLTAAEWKRQFQQAKSERDYFAGCNGDTDYNREIYRFMDMIPSEFFGTDAWENAAGRLAAAWKASSQKVLKQAADIDRLNRTILEKDNLIRSLQVTSRELVEGEQTADNTDLPDAEDLRRGGFDSAGDAAACVLGSAVEDFLDQPTLIELIEQVDRHGKRMENLETLAGDQSDQIARIDSALANNEKSLLHTIATDQAKLLEEVQERLAEVEGALGVLRAAGENPMVSAFADKHQYNEVAWVPVIGVLCRALAALAAKEGEGK